MRKNLLLAGMALLSVLACGRSENAKSESPKAIDQIVDISISDESPAPAMPEPPANNGYDIAVAEGQLQGAVQGFARVDKTSTGPDVGAAISSSAARATRHDTVHRFIRTAELRFRVKDVVRATLGIEDIVGARGGWVTETKLQSTEQGKQFIRVSEDSTLEVTRYQIGNEVTLRVPNAELDSTLRQIGRWVGLFELRNVHADDVRFRMMANAMAMRRAKAHAVRVARAIAEKGKKLDDITAAEDAIMRDEERADQETLDNMDIEDRIAYSTVTLYFYERTQVRRELIANEKNMEDFRPSLMAQLGAALRGGWRVLENVIVAAVSIWPILVILVIALIIFRRHRNRKS